ncbi:3-hydroxyacyl-CoA dehydrogenase NAD-binding domain-containing protein [Bradyrhizobium sp. CCBAU 11361]|uniref:3-hydroxyacyl-CoA dehydrogenase NAD-binding domain-containing protein n=1 Tax=Bradyrhizobium sp. CCBAU 11361 TaxID=1630812 RepID=UPI0023042808|nr:3-hydroxyacyl-CoA dehydrogenase NAD-binding domain-containing protein [Bradyrhizobium sp. CCBAU 11361]MDA9488297.1 3-hydroxyacyl-CoA dehydrogenase [Bradyrhizobium sp. CCBAU 11361]
MKNLVSYSLDAGVALVTIENPPVNALSRAVISNLIEALDRAAADPAVKAVVLTGGGRNFSAGADIAEVEEPSNGLEIGAVNRRCEMLGKPVVAAIHGWAFGGGLELALSCSARVGTRGAQMSLPEVKLGLIPGGGGTQRLPRIIGAEAALDMIVQGNPVDAVTAAKLGMIDRIVERNLLDGAKAFAREIADSGKLPIAARDRNDKLVASGADSAIFEARARELTRRARARGLEAPLACVDAIRMALSTPFDEALEKERAICIKLARGSQSKAQRHLFFAERTAARLAGKVGNVQPREICKAAVIGAGTMGGGIAMCFANAGIPVTLLELNQEALDRGLAVVRNNYDASVRRGSITAQARDERMALFEGTTSYDDLRGADIIVEAVFEDMALKKKIFHSIDGVAKPGAILASNTSFLDVNEIGAVTNRSADVLGMHFFSPANVMRLLEIVRGAKTAPDVLATALSVGKRIGKVPVVVGVCYGFVGNRMRAAQFMQLEDLLLDGALPEHVDKVYTDFGFPMGPFVVYDLAGIDIDWRNRKSLGKTTAIVDALCEARRFGQKAGKGFYLYGAGSRTPVPDPWVKSLIEDKARKAGISRRDVAAQEIVERTIYPMVNEGARILKEGIATRSSDIDVIWTHGYGFPIGKGGPMFWADQEGLSKIVERLGYWYTRTGTVTFQPAPLLKEVALSGGALSGRDSDLR